MFLAHLKRLGLEKQQCVLIMDGHGSYTYNLLFVYDMYQHNVSMAVLALHTTHATQPMDQYSFETFKVHFNDLLKDWCEKSKGMSLPKAAIFSVFEPAWQLVMTQHNTCSAFHVTGIFPLNPWAIPLEKFVGSSKCQELKKLNYFHFFNWLILLKLLFFVTHTHTHTHTFLKHSLSCKLYFKLIKHTNIYSYIFNYSSAEDDSATESEGESGTKTDDSDETAPKYEPMKKP